VDNVVSLWYGSIRKEAIVAQRRKHTGEFKTCVAVDGPNQLWAADITYIRLWRGFVYLIAIMDILQEAGAAISVDGRGRAFDNIFVERLWRSVKYEEVYLKEYAVVDEARRGWQM